MRQSEVLQKSTNRLPNQATSQFATNSSGESHGVLILNSTGPCTKYEALFMSNSETQP